MQVFPNDSRDEVELEYNKLILANFPSYGKFWEKFIGDNHKYKTVLLPRDPVFSKKYTREDKKNFREIQQWISKVNYSVFCNLVGAEKQLEDYNKTLPISNLHFFYWAIESFECSYFHIGNIAYSLEALWGKIKNNFFEPAGKKQDILTYLKSKNKEKNWTKFRDGEPKYIRDDLVHFGRHIFTQHNGELYLPLNITPRQYLWSKMKIEGWIPASLKLEDHIKLAYQTCEDTYSLIIPEIEKYLKREGIKI